MRIAIDVMGGDHAPDAILDGALDALPRLAEDDRLIFVGDEPTIRETITERGLGDERRLDVAATCDVVDMDETPVDAIRGKPDSSIARLGWLGSPRAGERQVDVIISAGNTGAMVAAAQMFMRRLPGVHRPGIAVTMPTFHGPLIVCDVGANIVPKPHHLHQYGHMAGIYAREVHGIDNPRVAMLSIGGEEGKGTGLVKDTARLMRADAELNYVGYCEGRELFDGKTDVLITEGFTGNVVLKLAEGLAAGLFQTIAHEIFEQDAQLAMKFEPVVKKIWAKHDWHEFGGAPLLGVKGNCVICHGSSQSRTIRAAVRNAISYCRHHVNKKIVQALARAEQVAGKVAP
ncbi:MAG: phosphate acyltransferase PlsX [Phycisphaerae bacterium]|nr:phosphate acyltransferase PlsX [Phycisphaerae bacterium]